jgi:hypothetical protein
MIQARRPNRRIEFNIAAVAPTSGRLVVRGRCYAGPLGIGDVFDEVFGSEVSRAGDRFEESRGEGIPVHLSIRKMSTYGRAIEIFDAGLTGELELEGAGAEFLSVGMTLGGNC